MAPGSAAVAARTSIVIAAHDAAATLAQTLDSVLAQTDRDWQAFVVDDGSRDETARVISTYAARDARIVGLRSRGDGGCLGASAARNRGLAAARGQRLLFLDSDDWLDATHLQSLNAALDGQPDAVAAYCNFCRVMRDGEMAPACRDASIAACAMDVFARTCGIAIHAVLVGRAAVRYVGGFDESLHTCEDWDLWQRVARLGGTWVHVDATLAFYRASERSLSHDVERMVDDAARVIGRGHGPDPRLHGQHVAHPNGAEDFHGRAACTALSYFALWCAAFDCGHGRTGMPLLHRAEALPRDPEHADAIGATLFDGVMVGQRVVPSQLASRWTMYGARIGALISSLTRSWDDVTAARRLQLGFERLVLQHDDLAQPRALALTLGLRVDLRRPTGVALPSGVGRVYAHLCNGEDLLAVHEFDASAGVTVREWLAAAAVALGRRRVITLAGAAVARAALPWRIVPALQTLARLVLRGTNAREAAWQTLLAAAGPPAARGGIHDDASLQQ